MKSEINNVKLAKKMFDDIKDKDIFPNVKNAIYLPEWISVKDRLPIKYGKYLVFCDDYIVISTFYNDVSEPHFYETEATHWMPLPEPPNE